MAETFTLPQEAFLSDLRALLQIRSIGGDCGSVTPQAPLGQGIYDAITYMCALGERFGFRTKNVDGFCGWIEMGEGEQMLGILAHLDTVSVDGGWLCDPFAGEEHDGMIYGRGVSDDKGPALLALYAMKAVADSGAALGCRVRLILGGDEENDWRCITRYKQTEELPSVAFTPDAVYPVTCAEKGIMRLRITGTTSSGRLALHCGKAINVVPAYAEAQYDSKRYEAHGKAAHAMQPHKGENALLKLCAELRAQGLEHPFFTLCAKMNVDDLGIACEDEASGALTINPSIAKVEGSMAELLCDLRIPVTVPFDRILASIQKVVKPLGFTAEQAGMTPPLHLPIDSLLVERLQAVFTACTGRSIPPLSTGGATYARAFANAVSFGALLPEDEVTYHQTNERWKISSMEQNLTIMANAILALAAPAPNEHQ